MIAFVTGYELSVFLHITAAVVGFLVVVAVFLMVTKPGA